MTDKFFSIINTWSMKVTGICFAVLGISSLVTGTTVVLRHPTLVIGPAPVIKDDTSSIVAGVFYLICGCLFIYYSEERSKKNK